VNKSTFGDFIDFDLQVVDSWRQCRISGTALAMLGLCRRTEGIREVRNGYQANCRQLARDPAGGRLTIISPIFEFLERMFSFSRLFLNRRNPDTA
jgi:hypothetical protein